MGLYVTRNPELRQACSKMGRVAEGIRRVVWGVPLTNEKCANCSPFWRYVLRWPVAERTVMAIAMKGFHPLHIKCGEDEQAFHFAVP